MRNITDISCKSCTSELQNIRKSVQQACIEFCFDTNKTGEVVLALDEACANVIRHSCEFSDNFKLEVKISEENGYGVFLIIDNCPPLSPQTFQPITDELLKPGGLGLHIIHQLMDSVTLLPNKGQGNRLELKVKL